MRVSIITPSFNQAKYIERTMHSVLSQQGDFELEYIVVDGGSTDGSVELIKRFAETDARVQWVSEPDHGQSDAINKGLHKATGDIIAFLNSDDTYEPGALQAVVQAAQSKPTAMWFSGYCHIVNDNDREMQGFVTAYKKFWLRLASYRVLLVLNYIAQPATFWRRAVLEEVGYINEQEHLIMDYEFWCRIGQQHRLHVIKQYLANFRITPNTKSSTQTSKQFADEIRIADRFTRNVVLRVLHRAHVQALLFAYRIIR